MDQKVKHIILNYSSIVSQILSGFLFNYLHTYLLPFFHIAALEIFAQ